MTDDRTDAAVVTWRTGRGDGRRIVFEPLVREGAVNAYERVTERFEDGRWRETGRETVTLIDIEAPENSDFLSLFPESQTEGNDGRI
jgi:hypothetical protein